MFARLAQKRAFSRLTPNELALLDKPWVHSYASVDLWIMRQSEEQRLHQIEKQGPIFRHIRDALLRQRPHCRGLEVTCTDGYFGRIALWKGAGTMDFVDVGAHIPGHESYHLEQTRVTAKIAGVEDRCKFSQGDLLNIEGDYDVCVCVNVLENVADPRAALAHLRKIVAGSLVVHCSTAYPNEESEDEIPSSERPWGSRFCHLTLIKMAVDTGWTVINERVKLMPPEWPGDRYLSSMHCV